jgi:hypothetical protein
MYMCLYSAIGKMSSEMAKTGQNQDNLKKAVSGQFLTI